MNFNCKKCNSSELYTKKSGNHIGLYCKKCGAYQKWLNKQDLATIERLIDENQYTNIELTLTDTELKHKQPCEDNSVTITLSKHQAEVLIALLGKEISILFRKASIDAPDRFQTCSDIRDKLINH